LNLDLRIPPKCAGNKSLGQKNSKGQTGVGDLSLHFRWKANTYRYTSEGKQMKMESNGTPLARLT
jgi:hypothetical protein